MFIGLLEDNAGLCEFFNIFLELAGFTFEIHHTAESFLQAAQRYDLILVDLLLDGDMTGVEVIERVREKQPDLPVIVVSAYSERDIQEAIQGLAHVHYICKPFRTSALEALIREAAQGSIAQA
jgi:DNA-binding response OmpR family regulator